MAEEKGGGKVSGSILLFYSFDVGDSIDLGMVQEKGLVAASDGSLSHFFKNYHVPFFFRVRPEQSHAVPVEDTSSVFSKMYHFGVLSFCYRVPFEEVLAEDLLEVLKLRVIDIKRHFDNKSEKEAQKVFEAILSATVKPNFCNIKSSYFAVQMNPFESKITPKEFKAQYGIKIASLLRLETQKLSDYQIDDILSSITGYYGQDLIIIDSEGAFIYDDEYFEAIEFFELALVEKVELQYFDWLLDQKLTYFYAQESYKIPWQAYVPLVSERLNLPVYRLAKLRVDISVISERLENSINLAGDVYYSKLYSMLLKKFFLKERRDSINRKLDIIKDLYTVHQDRLDTIHEGILTLVIIVLIALETFLAMMR
ncbi:MAG: hypothetical protein ABH827_04740 [bacterium]